MTIYILIKCCINLNTLSVCRIGSLCIQAVSHSAALSKCLCVFPFLKPIFDLKVYSDLQILQQLKKTLYCFHTLSGSTIIFNSDNNNHNSNTIMGYVSTKSAHYMISNITGFSCGFSRLEYWLLKMGLHSSVFLYLEILPFKIMFHVFYFKYI